METRQVLLLVAACTLGTASAAHACPQPEVTPPVGSTLAHDATITIDGALFGMIVPDGRVSDFGPTLVSRSGHAVELNVAEERFEHIVLTPMSALRPGDRYDLVFTRTLRPSRRATGYYWTGGELPAAPRCGTASYKILWATPPAPRDTLSLPARLALFGALPFAFGFAAARTIVIRRRRRIVRELGL